jgi:predicted RNase H-like HicB family nuclease
MNVRVGGRAYRVVLEQGPGNWSAYVPALPGLAATGADRAAIKAHLQEAIAFLT